MKIKFIASLLLTILVLTTAQTQSNDFPLGEKIRFKVYYGWFALGEAAMTIGEHHAEIDSDKYYYNHIEAKTIGPFSWLAGVQNDYWGYVNTNTLRTRISEKHLNERKGKHDQWNTFDYNNMSTHVVIERDFKDPPRKEFELNLKEETFDLHGTYMYLRSKLWEGFDLGDSLMLNTYWEDKLYDFGMEYGGVEKMKFDGKKVLAHKFYGLFPISTTFPKEKAVTVWVMERNGLGIPLLIEAEMKVGKVRCELKEYSIGEIEVFKSDD